MLLNIVPGNRKAPEMAMCDKVIRDLVITKLVPASLDNLEAS